MDGDFDIAIIGLACRFPGARNAEEFWRNLAAGVESIARLTDEEIVNSGAPESHLTAPNYVKAAPVLDDPGAFDAAFFGYTPGEARTMDPQHRILLELAHEALEDAGCDPARGSARVGVFTGAAMNTYFSHVGLSRNFAEDYIPTLIANDKDFLSTRLSYQLDLKGPSLTVQTACSTSLVAVHLARQSLLGGESDLALAGAISVRVPHRAGYFSDPGGVTSPDGHVRAFDAGANGTVFGSGGGIVILKRLRDALADGDTIRAVIRGSAINNDGAEKAGYTAPSVNSQADAVIEALANADVTADSISYLEAHGSGTPVGDPIEVRALTKAFRASTRRTGFCAVGSVKTNVGHLDAAAGMAGLIKTVLALQHRQIPPSLNFSQPNPEIDFAATPFFVCTRLAPWLAENGPRRAGIMATGMGGTNAHVVLEEAPATVPSPVTPGPKLLVLSARTETALAAAAENLRAFLESHPAVNLDDAAFTLQTGRRAMPHRRFVVATDREAASAALAAKPARLFAGTLTDDTRRPVVLLLPGVGEHYVGMGRELYATFPTFRAEMDRCAEILRPHLGHDIREILWPKNRDWKKSAAADGIDLKKMLAGNTAPSDDDDTRRLNEAEHLQPALFTIEWALAQLWMNLGVQPQAIVGHSMGEYVAACLSGVFSLEDALRLIVRRAQLVAALPPAKMLAVTLPEAELTPLLSGDISLALINGPSLCVVAGPPAAVENFAQTLTARGVLHRAVQNTHAFHSRLLDPIVPAFTAEVRKVTLSAPQIPFISNVTGTWITAADATDPQYWARHASRPARFADALETLWKMPAPLLLESGPGRTLGVLAQQHSARPPEFSVPAIASMRHHYENVPDEEVLLAAAGRLWLAGAEVRWTALQRGPARRRIPLPTYPFERSIHWLAAAQNSGADVSSILAAESEARGIDRWFYVPSWERTAAICSAQKTKVAGAQWIIFCDARGDDHGFREALTGEGAPVQVVKFGAAVAHHADGSITIPPRNFADCLRLFRGIEIASGAPLHLVHLGCFGIPADISADAAQDLGFSSLLHIAQANGELGLASPVKIAVVSSGLHQVIGDEELTPLAATVLGPCGAISKEFPNIACFNIDLPRASAHGRIEDRHRKWIVSEFASTAASEVISYRSLHRWRRKFLPITLPASAVEHIAPLRERGVYLITGGTGGIGLALAQHLAQTCRARLVLTKKTAFPEKAQWKNLAEHADTAPDLARTLRQLLEIEILGAQVEVMVADVADLSAMRIVFHATRQTYGALHGVLHAAGFVRAGLIQAATPSSSEAILSPKVRGTLVLRELLQDFTPDFLVLFSSLAALTSPFAHAEYSAANCFLDAFAAQANSREKYRTLTINWPVWKEVGVVAKLEAAMGVEDWKDEALKHAITTKDGLGAFRRALSSGLPQVIVSAEDLDRVLAQSAAQTPLLAKPRIRTALREADTSHAAEMPQDEIESAVAATWRALLGIESIGLREQFTHLGGHSLLALQIVARLRSAYRVDLTLRDFFEAPTIAELSAVIRERVFRDIANLSDEEVRELIAHEARSHE